MGKEANQWTGCYEGGWGDLIVPEAFSHPAKYSYKLTERMIGHAINSGWVTKGSVVADPFGGVGCGGIICAYNDLQWIGCELEPKFVELAQQNFELHRKKWEKLGCPQPKIVQGDSRNLCQVLAEADIVISSPPFAECITADSKSFTPYTGLGKYKYSAETAARRKTGYGQTPGQLGAMKPGQVDAVISSPPYVGALGNRQHEGDQKKYYERQKAYNEAHPEHKRPSAESMCYPCSDANLAAMKPGAVDCVLSSPPWERGAVGHVGAEKWKTAEDFLQARAGHGCSDAARLRQLERDKDKTYGDTDGNLGNLKPGDVDCVLSSPPCGPCLAETTEQRTIKHGAMGTDYGKRPKRKHGGHTKKSAKENVPANLGHINWETRTGVKSDTFWAAAKTIVEQCHQILKPGGHAIWVTKAFVRKGKIVDFPGDWQRLCESVGFKTVCVHHAMLVKETTHDGLFGEMTEKKERKSFFRRLAESKGSPAIDFETIICMERAGQ